VNPRVASRRDSILARNERVVFRMNAGSLGSVAVVMVGAGGVGNIRLAPALSMTRGTGQAAPGVAGAQISGVVDSAGWRSAREPRRVELCDASVARGDELGAFRLGSTVVMVFEPGKVELAGEVGDAVRFGQRMGRAVGGEGA
jgi:phosphatidylserine decarboxylase